MRVKILEAFQEMFHEGIYEDGVAVHVAVKGFDGCQMHMDGGSG